MTNTRYRVRSDVVAREVDGELLILDRQTDQVHKLNPMASYIWARLRRETNTDDIAKEVVEQFDVDPEVAAQDVSKYAEQLQSLHLVDAV